MGGIGRISHWLVFLVALAWATTAHVGPEEFACDVIVIVLGYWFAKHIIRSIQPMNVYPFDEVVAAVTEILEGNSTNPSFLLMRQAVGQKVNVVVFQQFNCAACGTKQTIDEPNILYTSGKCEECGAVTNLRYYGCNYAVYFMGRQAEGSS